MSVTENKHFSCIHSSIPRTRVCEEIGSLEKRINETFSNARQHDANILKFDEELETPRSAIVKNYSNVVPKKIKICSTIRKPSRHKRTSEIDTGNFGGWTTKKEKSVVIPEELEQKFQTVEPQDSEIIFETNHFVFEGPKIPCYQIESYRVQQRETAWIAHRYLKRFTKPSMQHAVSLMSPSLKNDSTLFREALTKKCHPTLTKLLENGNLLKKFLLQFVVWVETITIIVCLRQINLRWKIVTMC